MIAREIFSPLTFWGTRSYVRPGGIHVPMNVTVKINLMWTNTMSWISMATLMQSFGDNTIWWATRLVRRYGEVSESENRISNQQFDTEIPMYRDAKKNIGFQKSLPGNVYLGISDSYLWMSDCGASARNVWLCLALNSVTLTDMRVAVAQTYKARFSTPLGFGESARRQ